MEILEFKNTIESALAIIEQKNTEVEMFFFNNTSHTFDQVKTVLQHKNAIIKEQSEIIKIMLATVENLQNRCNEFKLNFDQVKHFYDVERLKNSRGFTGN